MSNTYSNRPKIVLIACGSFSPPTPMHFRMFEIAKDYFKIYESHDVIGGIVSPTHDSYGKKGLVGGIHRLEMLKIGLRTSNWIKISEWEIKQNQWSRTKMVLEYHQNYLNNFINSLNNNTQCIDETIPDWFPSASLFRNDLITVKLLCGADLLESFAVPGLWKHEDIEDILVNHGIVVITRSGSNPEKFIFESDVLSKFRKHITLIPNFIPNEVSSTRIRTMIRRGESVKYLLEDAVMQYIEKYGLYVTSSETMDKSDSSSLQLPSPSFKAKDTLVVNKSNVLCCAPKKEEKRKTPGKAIQICLEDVSPKKVRKKD